MLKKEKELEGKAKSLSTREKELEKQRGSLDEELEKRVTAETEKLREDARKKAEEKVAAKTATLEKELEEKSSALDEIRKREAEILSKERKLEDEKAKLELDMQRTLAEERKKLREELDTKSQELVAEKTQELAGELEEARGKIKAANDRESELRKEKRRLEEEKEALDLEVQRRIDEERKKIIEKALQQAEEGQKLKMREKDDLITSLQAKLEDAQRKIQTGSQEWQGEALEEQMIESLRAQFPYDIFEDVPKGIKGADIVQKVVNPSGKVSGVILWETKNTKAFSTAWIDKLKKDLQACGADVGVIMSVALPKEIRNFGPVDEVWVTDFASAIGLCTALRYGIIKIARERLIVQHQDSMKDIVYKYVTGEDFARRVRSVVDSYVQMQGDLESESAQ